MNAAAYARQLKQLLPPGSLFKLEPDSWLSKLLLAIADELARIDRRGEVLLDEWDPSTASETIAEWERALGIPDEDTPVAATLPERRANLVRKFIARGGATPAYFIGLAARLGFTVTIDETAPSTWRMNVAPGGHAVTTTIFRVGASRAGDRLSSRSNAQLEAVINRAKPAHTLCLFNYL
jgi:uncharacterized protein YmfQ (DUF2313 family)